MTWLNPWALMGLVAIAVPIVIHLLGRQRARVQKFPTLRFLAATRLMPTRRRKLNDLLLLALRIGVVVAACVALAQPHFQPASETAGESELDGQVSRAIIVDTSASMRRLGASGQPASVAARREAAILSGNTPISTTLYTAAPIEAVAGAVGWLSHQSGRRELVIVSDFAIGAIDSIALTDMTPEIGIKLVPVDIAPAQGPIRTSMAGRTVQVVRASGRTEVDWSPAAQTSRLPTVLAGSTERRRVAAAVEAAAAAAATSGSASIDSTRPIAIVYKEYEARTTRLGTVRPIDVPWMGDALAYLHAEPTLAAAALAAEVSGDTTAYAGRFSTILRNAAGLPVLLAGRGAGDGLELWLLSDGGSLTSAALISALSKRSNPDGIAELETQVIPKEVLARWERPAITSGPRATDLNSDGRWIWLIALVLLAIETVVRRMPRREQDSSIALAPADRTEGRAA